MKPLVKSILTARTQGRNWKQELYTFLLNYRATPHRTPKLPQLNFHSINQLAPSHHSSTAINKHEIATENDHKSKSQMKTFADKARHAKKRQINVDDVVLCRQQKVNKFSTKFSPNPCKVIEVQGSTVTAQRHSDQITRNISYFNRVNLNRKEEQSYPNDPSADDEEDETARNERNESIGEDVRRYPVRDRRRTNFYHDPNSSLLTH